MIYILKFKKLFIFVGIFSISILSFLGISNIKTNAFTSSSVISEENSHFNYIADRDLTNLDNQSIFFGNLNYLDKDSVYISILLVNAEDYVAKDYNIYCCIFSSNYIDLIDLNTSVQISIILYNYFYYTLIPFLQSNPIYSDKLMYLNYILNNYGDIYLSYNSINYKINILEQEILTTNSIVWGTNHDFISNSDFNFYYQQCYNIYSNYLKSNQIKELENTILDLQTQYSQDLYNVENEYKDLISSLTQQINDLNNQLSEKDISFQNSLGPIKQAEYNRGFQDGVNSGLESEFTIRGLLGTIFNFPLLIIQQGLNVELWGINIGGLLLFILCIGIVWIILKLILKFLRG